MVETVTLGLSSFGKVVNSCSEDVSSVPFKTFSELDDCTKVLLSNMLSDLPVLNNTIE